MKSRSERDAGSERLVVERLFDAMASGPEGEEPMLALFAEEAVFVENFTGERLVHRGKRAIRKAYRQRFSEPPPPDMELVLERIDRDGDEVVAEWSCRSPAFEEPRRGLDRFRIREGRIERLEVVVTEERK